VRIITANPFKQLALLGRVMSIAGRKGKVKQVFRQNNNVMNF
jgi:hypothetical protein